MLSSLDSAGPYVYGHVAEPFGRIGTAPTGEVAGSEDGGLTWGDFDPR